MEGLGAILYQQQEGQLRVIAYGSRSLSPAEKNYHLHSGKLEFLALKWSVTTMFRDYLYYATKFTVFTDYNPLVYITTTAKLNASTIRWLNELSDFRFDVQYRPGKTNIEADTMSRLPLDFNRYMKICTEQITSEDISAIMAGAANQGNNGETWITMNQVKIQQEEFEHRQRNLTQEEIWNAQHQDANINRILEYKQLKNHPSIEQRRGESKETKQLMRIFHELEIDDNEILKRGKLIVLPMTLRKLVYKHLHEDLGHLGSERVYNLAKDRFYWPNMYTDIKQFVTNKCDCIKTKKPSRIFRAPLQELTTSAPFEVIAIDFMHLERAVGGFEYILVIVDNFTRYAQAYATRNKSASTAAKHLFEDYILRFGSPARIHHDQGREFENKLFHTLEKMYGISRSRTTSYHPEGNGQCERMNRTILQMLRTLTLNEKLRWKNHLNYVIHAYNCTRHDSTGFSPFYLLFGRHPRLPIDLLLEETPVVQQQSYSRQIKQAQEAIREAHQLASANSRKSKLRSQRRRNKIQYNVLKIGDRVLVKNMRERGGPGKLRSYWEEDIYKVMAIKDDVGVVFEVAKEKEAKDKHRILHRNMLMPCNELPLETIIPVLKRKEQKLEAEKNRVRWTSSESEENDYVLHHPKEENTEVSDENGGTTVEESQNNRSGEEHLNSSESEINTDGSSIDVYEDEETNEQRNRDSSSGNEDLEDESQAEGMQCSPSEDQSCSDANSYEAAEQNVERAEEENNSGEKNRRSTRRTTQTRRFAFDKRGNPFVKAVQVNSEYETWV